VLERLLAHGILGGLALGPHYPGMERTLLVCATEKRTAEEIEQYGRALEACLQS
jgi:glycine dehydrogenase subunit 1